jgi:hypothetical protein
LDVDCPKAVGGASGSLAALNAELEMTS